MDSMAQRTNAKLFGKKFYQKNNQGNNRKAQSAMEYLMTYGWAILIIAVVLAALDFLGVFNGNTFVGPSCLATPGYICSNPILAISNSLQPNNTLSFTFEQDTGQTLYNVWFACAASANSSTGLPNTRGALNNGFENFTGITTLASGSSADVQGLRCYTAKGNLAQNLPIGSAFGGSIWIKYTTLGSSTPQYVIVSKFTAKVESTSAVSLAISPPLNTVTNTITVGSYPVAVAFSPNGAYAYVTNSNSGTVSVINTATNTVTNTITVGSYPSGVAFSPNGAYAYVTNAGSDTVNVINTSTNTVIYTITVGIIPHGVAFNPSGAFAYVANYGSGNISVINTATNTVTNTITLGTSTNPLGVAFNPSGAFAYVTNYGGTNVSVINTATNTVTNTITVGSKPYGVAFAPNGAFAYVTNYGTSTVSVINTATNTVTNTITVEWYPIGIAVSPNGAYVYVVNYGSNTVSVLSAG